MTTMAFIDEPVCVSLIKTTGERENLREVKLKIVEKQDKKKSYSKVVILIPSTDSALHILSLPSYILSLGHTH